ncbi:mercuric ion transport protein [Catalinimonas alkaloidigena]|uniref:mercuric transport protein MerTP n=1 Tax=Catalinimonas alkaloidigena TaxID=1075417 RepID=UPI0024062A3A|nr:mercuric transport protein MerTP [Catalinimonas alkaloidigena]MDF9799221.1 mercuric ion transport protein [Catalinimonas alkaloidigena]
MKTSKNSAASLGILTAITASLCCITPVLAFVAGASGVAATFSWLEPFRPYLIGLTVLVLGFAWYQQLKPRSAEEIACACEDDEPPSFWQSKKFLAIVTVVAGALLFFPSYADVFFPQTEHQAVIVQPSDLQETQFAVQGMTCTGCEEHVKHTALQLNGVIEANAYYEQGIAQVKFDPSLVDIEEIGQAIEEETGYKVSQPQ